MIPVYFILGTPASGRRRLVHDLIDNGLDETTRVIVLLAESEPADAADARLAARAQTEIRRWAPTPTGLPPQELPADATVFFLADPQANAIDQLEALKPWLAEHGAELARIFCVVNCQLAEKNPVLRQWFTALIHFSDVVFLTQREGVENKWLSDFIKHFTDEYFPCHFVQVRTKGELTTPLVWLDPTPRRVSQYFDEGEVYAIEGLETDDDEELEEEDTGLLAPEMYFARDLSGRRVKEVPDVRDFLPPAAQ
jgi:hypothetical protein